MIFQNFNSIFKKQQTKSKAGRNVSRKIQKSGFFNFFHTLRLGAAENHFFVFFFWLFWGKMRPFFHRHFFQKNHFFQHFWYITSRDPPQKKIQRHSRVKTTGKRFSSVIDPLRTEIRLKSQNLWHFDSVQLYRFFSCFHWNLHYVTLEKTGFLEKQEKKENRKKQVFF